MEHNKLWEILKEMGIPDHLPGGSDGKASACNAGDPGLIPGLGRSPGEGNGNPLQYSCLANPTDRGAWWVTVHGVTKELDMTSLVAQRLKHLPAMRETRV